MNLLTSAAKLITFTRPESPTTEVNPPFKTASLNGGNCDGFDTPDYFDSITARRCTRLAAQQKLGLWTEWRHRIGPTDRFDPVANESHLEQWLRLQSEFHD